MLISRKQQALMKTVGENKQVVLFICFCFFVIFTFFILNIVRGYDTMITLYDNSACFEAIGS